jgi:hypothetical protein
VINRAFKNVSFSKFGLGRLAYSDSETYESISGHLVGVLGRGIGPSQGLCLHTGQHNTEKCRHTSMPRAGFEPMIQVLECSEIVCALDRVTIGTGQRFI